LSLPFVCGSLFGKGFINLNFNEGLRYADDNVISLPGWSISYDGKADPQLNPLLSDGYSAVYIGTVGYLRGTPNYVMASEQGGKLSVVPFPTYPGNTTLALGHNIAWLDWRGGSYVSLSQTADLSPTDKYIWFYKDDGINLTVLANGIPVAYSTGEYRDPQTGEFTFAHTVADLSQFAGKKDVTLEFRYTTPLKRISNDDRIRLTVTIDELFFAPTNIPEPSAYVLLGLGGLGLGAMAMSRRKRLPI